MPAVALYSIKFLIVFFMGKSQNCIASVFITSIDRDIFHATLLLTVSGSEQHFHHIVFRIMTGNLDAAVFFYDLLYDSPQHV